MYNKEKQFIIYHVENDLREYEREGKLIHICDNDEL
jgi:hypothetical protein